MKTGGPRVPGSSLTTIYISSTMPPTQSKLMLEFDYALRGMPKVQVNGKAKSCTEQVGRQSQS